MPGVRKPSTAGKNGTIGSADDRQGAIASFIDHCQSAKAIADAEGEKFLSYLLDVTLLAAQEMQRPT